jgi:putative transposase
MNFSTATLLKYETAAEIFRDDRDRIRLLETLGEACEKTGWRIHAYVLMFNHYHLLLEAPQPNLVAGMKWLQGTYTQRFNARHRVRGHLFQGRYKAPVVEAEGEYFGVVSTYIHLNPVRAGILKPGERLRSYRWSSYAVYVGGPGPKWLEVKRVLGVVGAGGDDRRGRRRYAAYLESQAVEVAGRLRCRTVAGRRWIADRLGMGYPTRVTAAAALVKRARTGPMSQWRKTLEQATAKSKR